MIRTKGKLTGIADVKITLFDKRRIEAVRTGVERGRGVKSHVVNVFNELKVGVLGNKTVLQCLLVN